MTRIVYDVPMVEQSSSPLCWLACAVMILQFKRQYTPSTEMISPGGEDFRIGCTPGSLNNEESYARLRAMGFSVIRSGHLGRGRAHAAAAPSRRTPPVADMVVPSAEWIAWLLREHGPFILNHFCGSFWYGPNVPVPSGDNAHAVVVTGIETERNRAYFNNPWGFAGVPTTIDSIVGAIRRWEASAPGARSIAYL